MESCVTYHKLPLLVIDIAILSKFQPEIAVTLRF